jgi:hypothetical protein
MTKEEALESATALLDYVMKVNASPCLRDCLWDFIAANGGDTVTRSENV